MIFRSSPKVAVLKAATHRIRHYGADLPSPEPGFGELMTGPVKGLKAVREEIFSLLVTHFCPISTPEIKKNYVAEIFTISAI